MRYAAGAMMIVFAASLVGIACDETTEPAPDCRPQPGQECPVVVTDGGAPPDGAPPPSTSGDSGVIDPGPFDAGTTPPPTCKGLFELCSGQECCSPYACTNGTCR